MQDEAVYYVDYIYDEDNIQPIDILTIADMQDLWGKDIDEPYLCIKGICINSDMVTVYKKKDNTLKITLPNGISLMKFKATDEQCEMLQNSNGYYTLDIIGRANKNEWMGHVSAMVLMANLFEKQYSIPFIKSIGKELQEQPQKFFTVEDDQIQYLTDFSIRIDFYRDQMPEIYISKNMQSKKAIETFLKIEDKK